MKKLLTAILCIAVLCLPGAADADWRTFQQMVGEGTNQQYTIIHKFGDNPDVDTATTPEVIWSYGGDYTESTTADIDSISSSSSSDTEAITIQGLDADYKFLSQTVMLTGTTRAEIPIPYMFVFRAWNDGSTTLVGDCYIYVDTTLSDGVPVLATKVRAVILLDADTAISTGQTEMAKFVVPVGHIAYVYGGYVGISRGGNLAVATVIAVVTPEGKAPRTVFRTSLVGQGTSYIEQFAKLPRVFPEKTALTFKCTHVGANDTGVFAGFTILLKDLNPYD